MLTWQSNEGLAFDKETLEQSRSFRTPMADGWGLTVADDGVENAFLCGILSIRTVILPSQARDERRKS